MRHRKVEDRYQTLKDVSFYKIIGDRELTIPASFLLVYLRGLACYFGKPDFFWKDMQILSDLPNFSKRRLYNSRHELKMKGLIKYNVNHSRYVNTAYLMLDSMVADIKIAQTNPYSSGAKNAPLNAKNAPLRAKSAPLYNKNKDKEIYRINEVGILNNFKNT